MRDDLMLCYCYAIVMQVEFCEISRFLRNMHVTLLFFEVSQKQ